MKAVIELDVPEWQIGQDVTVIFRDTMVKHGVCKKRIQNPRYNPGLWNGFNGGTHYGQYFDMEDENRIKEMVAIASVLREYGIRYNLTKLKRNYRISITSRDYWHMDEDAKAMILDINMKEGSE